MSNVDDLPPPPKQWVEDAGSIASLQSMINVQQKAINGLVGMFDELSKNVTGLWLRIESLESDLHSWSEQIVDASEARRHVPPHEESCEENYKHIIDTDVSVDPMVEAMRRYRSAPRSKTCPVCQAVVHPGKNDDVTCSTCNSRFCFHCGARYGSNDVKCQKVCAQR